MEYVWNMYVFHTHSICIEYVYKNMYMEYVYEYVYRNHSMTPASHTYVWNTYNVWDMYIGICTWNNSMHTRLLLDGSDCALHTCSSKLHLLLHLLHLLLHL